MVRCLRRMIIGVALVLLRDASAAAAQDAGSPHTAQPERPTVATHAGTVAPGWIEIESGVERDREPATITSLSTPTLLKFGVASHVQFDVMVTTVQPASNSAVGLGDASVAVKWRVLDHAPLIGNFAVQPGLKFPTGSATRGTGSGTTDASLLLISSHVLGPVALDINVGYTHTSAAGDTANAMLWTVSTGTTIDGPWTIAAEIFGHPGFGARGSAGFLAGPTWTVRSSIVLDAGFIATVAGSQPSALYAGITWNIGRLW